MYLFYLDMFNDSKVTISINKDKMAPQPFWIEGMGLKEIEIQFIFIFISLKYDIYIYWYNLNV